jgi:hypothetical protein
MNVDGSNCRNLGEGSSPTFSADGQLVTFITVAHGREAGLMNAGGSGLRREFGL